MKLDRRSSPLNWRAALAEGVYPLGLTAKLTESPRASVASWFRMTKGAKLPPAIVTPHSGPELLVSFLGLVEARFVARFRKHGLSLQTIRKVARKLRDDYDLAHPFAERRFRTDGKRVMLEQAADDGERHLIDIMTDEFAFPSVVEPSLFDTIVYVEDIAVRMKPLPAFDRIVIDPRYAFGRPVAQPGHVPTAALAEAFMVEGDIAAVAEWYETEAESVTQAVAFEQRLAA